MRGGVRVVAWALTGLILLLSAGYVALYLSILPYPFEAYGFPGGILLFSIAGSIFGALIVGRQPRNAVGWILIASGFMLTLVSDAQLYAVRNAFVAPGTLPLQWLAAWLGSWLWAPGVILLTTFLPLLIPDGELSSRRSKLLGLLCALALVVPTATTAIFTFAGTGPVEIGADGQLAGRHSLNNFSAFALIYSAIPAVALVALIRMGVRLRRARGDERQQLKWFAYALGIVLIGIALSSVGNIYGTPAAARSSGAPLLGRVTAALFVASITAIPIGAGVSVLKYRLYDIDIVISRTLVYGAMAAFITAIYVLIAVGAGSLVGSGGKPNLGLSILATALVAVAFQPARERVQKVANRLAYGKRANPYEVLSQFSARVAESYAADEVLPRMARVLSDGTNARQANVWLRTGSSLSVAAAWPEEGPAEPIEIIDQAMPAIPSADLATPVVHQGELLGALTLTKRSGEAITPVERKLVEDLAHQAGLVLRNVGLTAELLSRLDDLRASRQRLVTAQDAERRRLERNLHDGAQQNLVALKVKLGLLGVIAKKSPDKVVAMAEELARDADEALETLRDLARGIYPPLLADKGLAAALQAQATKAALPVDVSAVGVERYPQELEGAVYFCCLEALQNIAKYANASHVDITLVQRNGSLNFEIVDDGEGFNAATVIKGAGLQNMEDRLDALGGNLVISSKPGSGTRLEGTIPVG